MKASSRYKLYGESGDTTDEVPTQQGGREHNDSENIMTVMNN